MKFNYNEEYEASFKRVHYYNNFSGVVSFPPTSTIRIVYRHSLSLLIRKLLTEKYIHTYIRLTISKKDLFTFNGDFVIRHVPSFKFEVLKNCSRSEF